MPDGKRQIQNQSYLTALSQHRLGIAAADMTYATGGATAVGAIGTYIDCSDSAYAAEMGLNIFAHLVGAGYATIEIWCCNDIDDGHWYFLESQTVAHGGQVFKISNAPPFYYKVIVTELTSDSVDIYYQYRK